MQLVLTYFFLNATILFIFFSCAHYKYEDDDISQEEVQQFSLSSSNESCQISPDDWELRPFERMRVKVFYMPIANIKNSSLQVVKEIMDDVIIFFGSLFKVRRADRIGLTSRGDCRNAGFEFPDHVINENLDQDCEITGGVEADYLVYVFARSGDDRDGEWWCETPGTLGWAMKCGENAADKRSIAAIINLCPTNLNTEKWNKMSLASLLRHELMHPLGLNNDFFQVLTFLDNGNKIPFKKLFVRRWKINPWYTHERGVWLIVSPKVKAFVRSYFNCSGLEGAELENSGQGGTRSMHWEKRIFGPETMTGYVSRMTQLSELTLAYFEDTSWFITDYGNVQNLKYGKGKGCEFAQMSCREYMDFVGPGIGKAKPFCNWEDFVESKKWKSVARECSEDMDSYSQCDWNERDPNSFIEPENQYFIDKWALVDGVNVTGQFLESGAEYSDGCPYWSELIYGHHNKTNTRIGDSICKNEFSQPPAQANWGAEIYGKNSICLKQEGRFEVYQCRIFGITQYSAEMAHGAGCYRYKCENGRLQIQANYSLDDNERPYQRAYKTCWGKGTAITIRRHQKSGEGGAWRYHKGILLCPDCRDVCENSKWKKGNFKCSRGIKINSTDYSARPCSKEMCGSSLVLLLSCQIAFFLFSCFTRDSHRKYFYYILS